MPTILIVDDEAHILRITSMWLRRHGYEIFEATNGAEALELLEHQSIDLVITDMNMPVLSGLDLVRTVRTERGSDVPFVLLTARCDQEQLAGELSQYGVRIYPKPFVPSRLVEDVGRLLETAQGGQRVQ